MVGDGVLACSQYAHNFKPGKGKAFAYFTQICYRAFQARIRTEQKQGAIKHRQLDELPITPAMQSRERHQPDLYRGAYEKYEAHVARVEELRMKRKEDPPQWEKLVHERTINGPAYLARNANPNSLRLSIAAIRLIGEAEYVEIFRLGKKLKIAPADPDVEGVRRCYDKASQKPRNFLLSALYPDLDGKVELHPKGGVLLGEIK